jgi:hypothetical protein
MFLSFEGFYCFTKYNLNPRKFLKEILRQKQNDKK